MAHSRAMSTDSELTACVIVGPRRERAAVALRSLLEQEGIDGLSILLVDCSHPSVPPVVGSDSAPVRTLRLPPDTVFPKARLCAVEATRTRWLAFMEEHCRAHRGWAAALLAAHREGWSVVGPVVGSGNPGYGRSDLCALAGYGYWSPPQPRREVSFLPYLNTSFEVAILRALGTDLEPLLGVEPVLHHRLRRNGARLLLEPAARIDHLHETDLAGHARGTYRSHRVAARLRAAEEGWGIGRRLLHTLAVPATPVLFLARLRRRLRDQDRQEEWALARSGVQFLYLTQLCAAWGQAVGLWLGPGDGVRRFTAFELDEERPGGW